MNTLMMYYQKLASSGQKWKKKKKKIGILFLRKSIKLLRGTCINTFFYVAITREIFVSAAKDGF